jgi:hypothetical protein
MLHNKLQARKQLSYVILIASLEGYMSKILEELQVRVADSKSRLDIATKSFQSAQAVFQQAQQDHNVWNMALVAEQRDEQRRAATATEKQLPLPTTAQAEAKPPVWGEQEVSDLAGEPAEPFNKTDTVRALLRRHPGGMTAVDIWNEVSDDFKHRPYLYSVLKRLRDREEIVKRRNKYCLKLTPKTEEAHEQTVVQ